MTKQNRSSALILAVPAMFVLLTMGCHPAVSTDATAGGNAAAKAGTQTTAQAVKDNPSIPPEAKANILRQTQGRTGAPMPGATQ